VAAAALGSAGPPAALFRQGYDLCRAVPLAALRAAGGQHYRAGLLAGGVCTWERADLKAGVSLSTHPPAAAADLVRSLVSQPAFHPQRVTVPGASKAVLVTIPSGRQPAKDLVAVFKRGVVQVNMTAPGKLPASRLLAVMKLVARG
jgi:hypothetical protein